MTSPEDRPEPFDETVAPRQRRRCFFCEAEKSDEWKFLARLNAFVCKACQERLEKKQSDERNAG
jgi:hypothetical protein